MSKIGQLKIEKIYYEGLSKIQNSIN